MLHTIRYAFGIYHQKSRIEALKKRAMSQDWGFEKSALAYAKLYVLTSPEAAA
jgi:starch synthase